MELLHSRILILSAISFIITVASSETKSLENLDAKCLQCLCEAATGCDKSLGCAKGYCGAYRLSRIYWVDAGREAIARGDNETRDDFKDCVTNLECAQRTVAKYLAEFVKDCNGDGKIDCDDYLMINVNGGFKCSSSLDRNERTKLWAQRYNECMQ